MKIASIQVQANDIQDYRQAADKLVAMVRQAARTHDLVLVPECAFPAYYLDDWETDLSLIREKGRELLEQIKEIARCNRAYIAYGYVEEDGDRLYNTALLIDRGGSELLKKRKSFLWHFDHRWFTVGEDPAVVETEFGKVALVICCDARSPEIVRLAAVAGADIIIDLANLTATGSNISELHNAQSAYMLSVRALENNVWLAMSDKWGVETHNITYAGRSAVYGPDGTCHYQAGSDADEIVSVEIPTDGNGRIVRRPGRVLPPRSPALYGLLAEPTVSLPIKRVLEQTVSVSEITPYISTVAGELSAKDYITMIRRLGVHGSQLICMPPSRLPIHDLMDEIIGSVSGECIVIATMVEGKTTKSYFLDRSGLIGTYRNAHQNGGKPFVMETPWGNIGIMHDEEALLPEWPRVLMLSGADCLFWPNRLPASTAVPIARTRAAENRVFLVTAQSQVSPAMGQIIDPNGLIMASTLESQSYQACGTFTCFANSRVKDLVPGTNVVYDRHPEAYGNLIR